MRFLLLLLGDPEDVSGLIGAAGGDESLPGGAGVTSAPLLERLVRTLHRAPERLVTVQELVRTFEADGLLPEDVVVVWTALAASSRGKEALQ